MVSTRYGVTRFLARVALVGLACGGFVACGADPPVADVVGSATVGSHRTIGIAETIMSAPHPMDGSWVWSYETVVLGEPDGFIQLEFADEISIGPIILQADADDTYLVERSLDGSTWETIWTVEPVPNARGLRTRTRPDDGTVPARYVRVRAEGGDGLYFLGALRFPETLPTAPAEWLASQPVPGFYPWFDRFELYPVKALVAVLGTLVVGWGVLRRRRRRPTEDSRAERAALLTLGVLGAICWFNFFQYSTRTYDETHTNYWDIYHYYLGAKYAPELGYTHLYNCTVDADSEDGFATLSPMRRMRNLETNKEERPVATGKCAGRFAPERWASFKADLAFLRSKLPPEIWGVMLMDHGYNAPPTWGVLGRALASSGQISNTQVFFLTAIDPVLLIVMWVVIWRTFGWRAACIALIFWGTSYPARSWWTAGAILRHDWIFLSVLGVCLLRRGKMLGAGAALAGATLLRIFPLFFVVGVLFKAGADLIERRTVVPSPAHLRFALGGLLTVAILVPASFLTAGGAGAWPAFAENSRKHLESPVANYMGLKTVMRYVDPGSLPRVVDGQPDANPDEKRPAIGGAGRLIVVTLTLLSFVLLAAGVPREPEWSAAILGAAVIPFATELTGYYYAIFLLFAFLASRRPWIGAALCGLAVAFEIPRRIYSVPFEDGLGTYFWSSIAVVLFAGAVLTAFATRPVPPEEQAQ